MGKSDFERDQLRKLGKSIASARVKKGVTQEVLAALCGLHRTYIGSVERGERNPSYISLLKITDGLGVSLSELVNGLGD